MAIKEVRDITGVTKQRCKLLITRIHEDLRKCHKDVPVATNGDCKKRMHVQFIESTQELSTNT